jgi:phosphoribosylamine---glycine ligase
VMCSPGYPEAPKSGGPIGGLGRDGQLEEPRPGVSVIHAGTDRQGSGFVTAGGRVLGLVALGAGVADARDRAYGAAGLVDFPGAHYRRDIAEGVDAGGSEDGAAVEGAAAFGGSTP